MMTMIMERVQSRLGQSREVTARAGIDMLKGGYAAQNDMHNAIWRCLLCRHGDACRDWLAAGRTEVPGFCPNRAIYGKFKGAAG